MITSIDRKTALVLIDLQKGSVETEKAHPLNEILEKTAVLLEAFRQVGLPVVIVNLNPIGARWANIRVDEPSVPNSTEQTMAKIAKPPMGFTDIVPEIKTQPNDIFITKRTWNAFFNTSLDDELIKRQVTGIVLAGISTSVGVEGTARAASELSYNISFAVDAMTDIVLEAHHHSTKYIFPRIGEVGTVQEIIDHLG